MRRFRYDAKHDILKRPRGKILRPGKPVKHGRFFHSRRRDCARCDLASLCLSKGRKTKSVVMREVDGWETLAEPLSPTSIDLAA